MSEDISLFCLLIFLNLHVLLVNCQPGPTTSPATQSLMFWPNASVPFYVDPEHFDHEQALSIMTSLSVFGFKTCLKFAPVLTRPSGSEHVLLFENPNGIRKCSLSTDGHSVDEPHRVTLGYECLHSPQVDMMIMRALGFPFEHNRPLRDVYIDVQFENIEPGSMELFTKDNQLAPALRVLPYDPNSVMHFGDRDFSKNGHRTIIYKDSKIKQNRDGLSPIDIRKIEIIYGPECRQRDRQEKIELCQSYPEVARRKRDVDALDVTKSLRVNPDITPPPLAQNLSEGVSNTLKELGVDEKVEEVVESVYKVSSLALQNARAKYCNGSKPNLRSIEPTNAKNTNPDILGIIELVTDFAKSMVDNAVANLTAFCESSDSVVVYQRARCAFYAGGRGCPQTYRSTNSGAVRFSTQHRPIIPQSTKHQGNPFIPYQFANYRAGTDTEAGTTESLKMEQTTQGSRRKKRDIAGTDEKLDVIVILNKTDSDSVSVNKGDTVLDNATDINPSTESSVIPEKGKTVKDSRRIFKRVRDRSSTVSADEFQNIDSVVEKGRDRMKKRKQENNDGETIQRMEKKSTGSREEFREKMRQKHENSEDPYNEKKKMQSNDDLERKRKKIDRGDRSKKNLMRDPARGDREKKRSKGYIPQTVVLSKKNQEFYKERRWPDGIVRYVITEDAAYDMEDMRRRLDEVNSILKKKTCVRLQEIKEGDTDKYEDYLVVDTSPDYVTGRVGGRQVFGALELYRGGQHRQHAAMMAMAMLGFYFEVSRHDRDKYIRVHMRHVRPDKLHHFEKIREDATLPLAYDYKSATHPAWQFWRKIGKTGISTVATYKDQDPDGLVMKALGQNPKLLSDLDIIKINSVYGVACFHGARRSKSKITQRNDTQRVNVKEIK